jgi:hypothetical protein
MLGKTSFPTGFSKHLKSLFFISSPISVDIHASIIPSMQILLPSRHLDLTFLNILSLTFDILVTLDTGVFSLFFLSL